MKKLLFLSFAFLLSTFAMKATHNRAGEITYEWVTGYTYKITITTYTKETAPADRCELTIEWGDNTSSILPRQNGPSGSCPGNAKMGQSLGNDVRLNVYTGTHTYQGPGFYKLAVQDLNRNDGVRNIPSSINVPFYIETFLFIDQNLGPNNSPVLLNPPIDDGCLRQYYIHNPTAYDPDGDSLGYELIDCKGFNGVDIKETYDPNFVNDPVKIDPRTGDFVWDKPQAVGEYNFAILITEYRRGPNGKYQVMGKVTRDMQVTIKPCNNLPPTIDPVGPFCVEAGQLLQFNVTGWDIDGHRVTLSAEGGPLDPNYVQPTANFTQNISGDSIVTGQFSWNTACSNVRQQPYTVNFTVRDRPTNGDQPLTFSRIVDITVVAPPPQNPSASPSTNGISLSWLPSACSNAVGYRLYRRKGPDNWTPGVCETGVPEYTGYEQIAEIPGLFNTSYQDTDTLVFGEVYCYRVIAYFDDEAESYASIRFCAELPQVVPIIFKADVVETDFNAGQIDLGWYSTKQIDSNSFPPPYSYVLEKRNPNTGNFDILLSGLTFVDTLAVDSNIDTETQGHLYRVKFISNNTDTIGISSVASSPFLQVIPGDEQNRLQIQGTFPWQNFAWTVFKENTSGGFDSLKTVSTLPYIDDSLTNGETYCYFIRATGTYSSPTLKDTLINRSQIACGTPIDTIAPCAPELFGNGSCENGAYQLFWEYPTDPDCPPDAVSYNIYFKRRIDDPWPSSPFVENFTGNSFLLNEDNIAGCYAVTVNDDAVGTPNESEKSNVICIDGCPEIELPNVFSPNNNAPNNLFHPVNGPDGNPIFKGVESFEIVIFNRWGGKVWESSSVEEFVLNGWDGKNEFTNQDAPEGVYYYVLTYRPFTYSQPQDLKLTGFIHLFR